MTTDLVFACDGKSHSWLTPTISRSNPSAKRISVADGSNDTIRMTKATLTQLWRSLFIEKILPADLVEGSERLGPVLHDFFHPHARLQPLHSIRPSHQP